MGLWAKIKSGASKVCGAAKTVIKKTAQTIKKAVKHVQTKCSKLCAQVSGKNNCDKAKQLYEKNKAKIENAKKQYGSFAKEKSRAIQKRISTINSSKKELITHGFNRFIAITSKIAAWEIVARETSEDFEYKLIEIEKIKDKAELFLIDFDDQPVKSYFKAVISLGFWSRNDAIKTLQAVELQEESVDRGLKQIDAEKLRLQQVDKALQQIEDYFIDLMATYNKILDELAYGVNLVVTCSYVISPHTDNSKIDCYFMPTSHLNCLMAADKMTRLLHDMSQRKYLGDEGKIIRKDQTSLKETYQEVDKITLQLAA